MDGLVEVVFCANPLALTFNTSSPISRHNLCIFFTSHNIEFSGRELSKVGPVAERITVEILQYREVRQLYVCDKGLTVVLKGGKTWETLPDQIVRIIEKAFEEFRII